MTATFGLTIRNEISEIALVRDALDRFGGNLNVAQRELMQLQAAMDEILSNVIKYAWPTGGEHEVLVRMSFNATEIALDIFDDGKAFDPRLAPEPEPAAAGKRPPPGGVGIHMVRRLVDAISYERIHGRNHTRLTKNCAVEGPSERASE
jgi:anti-sigma regulatory factor (Ser/Thr protein kinase)